MVHFDYHTSYTAPQGRMGNLSQSFLQLRKMTDFQICNILPSVETPKEEQTRQFSKAPGKISRISSMEYWLCPQCCFYSFPEEAGEVFIQPTKDLLSALLVFPFILDMALVIKQFL